MLNLFNLVLGYSYNFQILKQLIKSNTSKLVVNQTHQISLISEVYGELSKTVM